MTDTRRLEHNGANLRVFTTTLFWQQTILAFLVPVPSPASAAVALLAVKPQMMGAALPALQALGLHLEDSQASLIEQAIDLLYQHELSSQPQVEQEMAEALE